jgi:GDSL-like Lipase/Acylhydrolase family
MQWYEDEIKKLETEITGLNYKPGLTFYGSSSIRLWETLEEDFKEYSPLNVGFGGSTMEACSYFFDRLFTHFSPLAIILYAGDNDLGDGKSPEEVFSSFKRLTESVHKRFGDIPLGFISIKPSITRIAIIDKIIETNRLIEEEIDRAEDNLFYIDIFESMLDGNGYPKPEMLEADGLHINKNGYQTWKEIIISHINDENLKLQKAS